MSTSSPAASRPSRRSPLPWVVLGLIVGLLALVVRATVGRGLAVHTERIHTDFAVLEAALERYRADVGSLPEEADLEALLVPKYLPSLPLDPWGQAYRYASNGERIFLATFGRGDDRGGNGEAQDHTNHDGHPRPTVK